MIVKEFLTDKGKVSMYPSAEYITVVFPATGAGDCDAASIPWDRIEDVEFISEKLSECTVGVFKMIVQQLGTISRNRHIFEALL